MQKTALVLSGGASRGAYELGVWQAIKELHIPIDMVTGTSIGAVNGALFAQDAFSTAQELWNALEYNKVFNVESDDEEDAAKQLLQTFAKFSMNLIKEGGSDVRELLSVVEPYINEEAIRQSSVSYGLVTLNIDEKIHPEWFIEDIPQGRLLDYIYASCSVSPAFKPYLIDGQRYVDGCYYDNMPVHMALEKGAHWVIAVNLEAFGFINKKALKRTPKLTLIRSHWSLGPTFFFDSEKIKRNTRLGYLDAMKALGLYDGQAYAFQKGNAKNLAKAMLDSRPQFPLINLDDPSAFFQEHRGASKKLLTHLRRRLINKNAREDLFLAWAENAGELYELDPLEIYSLDSFNSQLREKHAILQSTEIERMSQLPDLDELKQILEDPGNTLPAFKLRLGRFKESLKYILSKEIPEKISKRGISNYLLKLLQESQGEIGSPALANLAVLLPNEFLAALYLFWLNHRQ